MKKISIITINYNNASGLEKTIRSVVDQKNADFEYLVIDGSSEDGSKNVIEKYQDKINYWVSEKDSGIYNAQNKGIKASSGEFLLFLNSGDFLCNDKVLQQVLSYQLDKDIVYGNMLINWGKGRITKGKMPHSITVEQMYKDTLWHPVSFIKKTLFDQFGLYNETYRMVADYEFFFKVIIANKVSTKHIPVFICEFNTEGISSDPGRKRTESDERGKVIKTYLNATQIAQMEKKMKGGFFNRLFKFIRG